MPSSARGPATPPSPLPPDLSPRGRPATRSGRWARRLAAVLAVAVVATSAASWVALTFLEGGIARIDVFEGLENRPERGDEGAVNYLVVGSDRREGMTAADIARLHLGRTDGERADVMILIHISQRNEKAVLVSFPRDSYVEIPAHRARDGSQVPATKDKINSAYARGGPTLAVAAVERNTGLRVDHYLEVNFIGFERIVNAVGGVEVCTPKPLRDEKSGLDLKAGRTELDGAEGVAYVRARSIDNDIGRIERQQRFVGSIVNKATSTGVLLNPVKLTQLVDAALKTTRTDPGLRRKEMLTLAKKLSSLSPAKVQFMTVPLADIDHRVSGIGSTVLWDDAAARTLFADLKADRPPGSAAPTKPAAPKLTVAPADVRVRVLNGSGVAGLGVRAARELADAGFVVVDRARTAEVTGAAVTTIRFDERYTESVKTLQAALPGAQVESVKGLGRTLQVVVGSSYTGVTPVTVRPPASPGAAPKTPVRTAADDVCR